MLVYSGCHLILFQLTRPLIFFLFCAAKSLHGEVFGRVRQECVRTVAHRTALDWVSGRRRQIAQNSYWLRELSTWLETPRKDPRGSQCGAAAFLRNYDACRRKDDPGDFDDPALFRGDFTNRKEWKKTLQRWVLRRCTCSQRIPSPDRGSEKIRLPGVFFKRRLQRWGD